MLRIKNGWCILGGKPILQDVTTEFKDEAITALIGPSGGGKSTLLKCLSGVLPLDKGEVRSHTDSISLLFQEGALFDSISVIDNVAFPLVQGRVPVSTLPRAERAVVQEKALRNLERVGLKDAVNKLPGQLSGGMRRRTALARALVTEPKILLLDDPTAGLDPVASSVIMQLIVDVHNEYKPTTIICSHDLRRLLPIAEYVLALSDGHIVYDGKRVDLGSKANPELHHFVSCRYDWA
jgi:phospholipid/cholesterol/gamma-HCH transport system ATP-binding protein